MVGTSYTSLSLGSLDKVPLSGGGYQYLYNFNNGSLLEVPDPPIGFNPLTASSEELKAYGFPARPINPSDLQSWDEAMSAYKFHTLPTSDGALEFAHLGNLSTSSTTSTKGVI